MSKILYYGDPHFGHANVIKHDGRPFNSVDEMDRILLEYYNDTVNKDDEVIIDGDLIYRSKKDPEWYLKQMTGKKHLVLGNHDGIIKNNKRLYKYFEEVDTMLDINDNGRRVIICHFPIAEWNCFFRNAYHVYAHIHNNLNDSFYFMAKYERALNSGCMINGFVPVTLNELIVNNKIFKESVGVKNEQT